MGEKLIGNRQRGILFIVSAPAGTGKTTLVDLLTREFPSIVASVSYTTRPPRNGEVRGVHYNFISETEFVKRVEAGEFLEYVQLYGTYYGTSQHWVEERLNEGKHVILTIDTQGRRLLKERVPCVSIFVEPPSKEELRKRLIGRGTDPEEIIQKRLDWAEKELEAGAEYDYLVMNDLLEVAYQVLRSIVIAEDHRKT